MACCQLREGGKVEADGQHVATDAGPQTNTCTLCQGEREGGGERERGGGGEREKERGREGGREREKEKVSGVYKHPVSTD